MARPVFTHLFFTQPTYPSPDTAGRLPALAKTVTGPATLAYPVTTRGSPLALLPFRQSKSKRFEALVRPHLRALYSFAYRLTGSQHDAEDLVQDVVTKLVPKVDELERVEDLKP